MWYMTLASLLLKLINAAADGRITPDEVADIITDLMPDYLGDIMSAVEDAMDDGKITVDEVLSIVQKIAA